jgi:hypothetical protein
MDMSAEAGRIFDSGAAVDATVAAATSNLAVAARLEEPFPEAEDYRGTGVVDFATDRLWLKDRLLTHRMKGGGLRRIMLGLVNLGFGGERDLYFEGGMMWVSARRGGWQSATGDRLAPKFTRHPLCAFAALAYLPAGPFEALGSTIVHDTQVQAYGVILGEAQFDPRVWSHVGGSRSELKAIVCVDSNWRIHRVSYESSFDPQDQSVLWSITDFWNFGTDIDSIPFPTPPDARPI